MKSIVQPILWATVGGFRGMFELSGKRSAWKPAIREARVNPNQRKPRPARSAGILLHPSSLPGPFRDRRHGPGGPCLGRCLAPGRQTWWQILPLGPTGFGDSPYQCFSAFAGNPHLISPDALVQDGFLSPADLPGKNSPGGAVDFVRGRQSQGLGYWRGFWETFQAGKVPRFGRRSRTFASSKPAGWMISACSWH